MTAWRLAYHRLQGLGRRQDGVAAVEFALILPIALMILSLVVFGGQIYGVQRKVSQAASTVANIFAQGNNNSAAQITSAELQQIFGYANLVLFPNDATGVQVVLSQLSVSTTNGVTSGKVVWSAANANAQPHACGTLIALPAAIAAAFSGGTGYVIFGEVNYPYQPAQIYVSLPQMTLHDSSLMIPRTAAKIDTSLLSNNC
jgi:Flp pilus assembly protein TadG